MTELTEAQAVAVLERARAELAKLGVEWEPPLDDRIYDALLALPPRLGRPCSRADLIAHLDAAAQSVGDALARLLREGRVIRPTKGMWVAVTMRDEP